MDININQAEVLPRSGIPIAAGLENVYGTIPHHHVGSSSFKLRWTRLAMRFQKSTGSLGWFYSSVELLGAERFSDL